MKSFLCELFYLFIKISGLIYVVLFPHKTYFEDVRVQGYHIKGPAILVSNHTSIHDYFHMMYTFLFNHVYYMVAEVLYKSKIFAWVLRSTGNIRVNRGTGGIRPLNLAMDYLNRGKVVGIFPQGRLSKEKKYPFLRGAAKLALDSGAPVIPMYFKGNYGFFRRSKAIVGKPMYFTEGDPAEITKQIEKRVYGLEKVMEDKEKTHVGKGFVNFWWFVQDWVRVTSWPFLKIIQPVKVFYEDKEKSGRRITGKTLIMSNHVSQWDPIMISHVYFNRRNYVITAEVLFDKRPMLGWFMTRMGSIRIERDKVDLRSVKESVSFMNAGGLVTLFPEGHVATGDDMEPFKSGTMLMAAMADAPIVPIYIEKGYSLFRRMKMVIGKPIDIKEHITGSLYSPAALESLTILVQDKVQSLSTCIK